MTKNETILLESISDKLEQCHKAIYGNGDPKSGMAASQVRVEERLAVAAEAAKNAAEAASSLAKSMDGLVVSVNDHHTQVHLANLLRSVKFWGYGLLAFVVVNVLIDVLHPFVVALIKAWTGVAIP